MSSQAIYGSLGQISIYFASIQHRLIDHLAYLLTVSDTTLVSPYVLDRLSLDHLIKKTTSVAKLRLSECPELFEELNEVVNVINSLRQQRNLFIHGDWFIEELIEDSTYITVVDYKPQLDKKTGIWKYMHPKKVNHKELEEMLGKVKETFEQLIIVIEKIRDAKLR